MHIHNHTRLKRIIIPLLGGFLLAIGVGNASARSVSVEDRGGASAWALPDAVPAGLPAFILLDMEECDFIYGGDVRMVLNAERTRLTVNVIDNEYEARLGRIPPKEVYEIEVHNRVKETCEATFMGTAKSRQRLKAAGELKSSASPFPEGNWLVTEVKDKEGKYGPYMINTGAVGKVDVYGTGSTENGIAYLGLQEDTGYAIHANTTPFEYSKSYGCLVARQDDVVRLAGTLKKDKAENKQAVQTIRVRGRQGRRGQD